MFRPTGVADVTKTTRDVLRMTEEKKKKKGAGLPTPKIEFESRPPHSNLALLSSHRSVTSSGRRGNYVAGAVWEEGRRRKDGLGLCVGRRFND